MTRDESIARLRDQYGASCQARPDAYEPRANTYAVIVAPDRNGRAVIIGVGNVVSRSDAYPAAWADAVRRMDEAGWPEHPPAG